MVPGGVPVAARPVGKGLGIKSVGVKGLKCRRATRSQDSKLIERHGLRFCSGRGQRVNFLAFKIITTKVPQIPVHTRGFLDALSSFCRC